MASFWLSPNLTTQNWMADRSEFLFSCMTARISDYYQGQMSDQLEFTQILHGVAEDIAQVDAYTNFLYEQNSGILRDPLFAHITEGPLFNLPVSFPRPSWYDTSYLDFLTKLAYYYANVTTRQVLENIFKAYFQEPYSLATPNVQVTELWTTHGADTYNNIVDQHVTNIRLPDLHTMDKTTLDMFNVFDQVRQAHTVLRIVASPVDPEYIHGATIKDPFYLKLYIIEDRNPVVILKWADMTSLTFQGTGVWFKNFTGSFSQRSQAQSGVFAPGILPDARYRTSYSFIA